jgi:hypothetical protein
MASFHRTEWKTKVSTINIPLRLTAKASRAYSPARDAEPWPSWATCPQRYPIHPLQYIGNPVAAQPDREISPWWPYWPSSWLCQQGVHLIRWFIEGFPNATAWRAAPCSTSSSRRLSYSLTKEILVSSNKSYKQWMERAVWRWDSVPPSGTTIDSRDFPTTSAELCPFMWLFNWMND